MKTGHVREHLDEFADEMIELFILAALCLVAVFVVSLEGLARRIWRD